MCCNDYVERDATEEGEILLGCQRSSRQSIAGLPELHQWSCLESFCGWRGQHEGIAEPLLRGSSAVTGVFSVLHRTRDNRAISLPLSPVRDLAFANRCAVKRLTRHPLDWQGRQQRPSAVLLGFGR